MPFFSRRETQQEPNNKRKIRRPEGVSRRRKRELGFETLEDRRVMSAQSPLADIETVSYSSATPEGQLAILQQEIYRYMLQSLRAGGSTNGVETYSIPTDPLLNNQWHLINSGQQVGNPDFQNIFGTVGEDINVAAVWNQQIFGTNVVVAVIDSGVQTAHPDLAANIHPTLELNALGAGSVNPNLTIKSNAHGTAVAGLIGAVANNDQGGTGVAPGVQLVPIRLIETPGTGQTEQAFIDAFRFAIDEIDITNNSWGPSVVRGLDGPTADEILALRDSIFFGRDGLGVIHVFAAGNSGKESDTSSYNGWVNSRYTIGVTGVDHDGQYNNIDGTVTGYPETGSSVLVAAPTGSVALGIVNDTGVGSGIWTTDTIGETGFNSSVNTGTPIPPNSPEDPGDRDFHEDTDYTSRFNGTSAAAPLVSGVIALMLEANPNLSWRDVQEILVRSARQNAKFDTQANGADKAVGVEYQSTWIVNQVPLFHDPDVYDPLIPAANQLVTPTLNPLLSFNAIGSGAHYAPTPQVLTNGAGYTVSQGRGTDSEQIGFAHGVVDAELAVVLAKQWTTKGQHLASELTFTTAVNVPGANNLPAAEVVDDVFGTTGDMIIPGGLGGGAGFSDYWEEYLVDDPDFSQTFLARGTPLELTVPDTNNMSVESVEVTVTLGAGSMVDFLNNVRMVLVSPSGTHSEMNYYFVDPAFSGAQFFHQADPAINPGLNANGLNGVTTNPTDFLDPATTTDTGVTSFTFSTNRIWGERSDDALVFDTTTGLPYIDTVTGGGNIYNGVDSTLGDLLTQGWQLHFENYGNTALSIGSLEIAWHGSPIAENTQRIQGLVGVDDNQDDFFNYSRVIQTVVDLDGNPTTNRLGEVVNIIDPDHESMGANVTVTARRVSDGVIVDRFVTGADGNFYFDLVPDEYIISVEDADGRVALDDSLSAPGILKDYQASWHITEDYFQVWDRDSSLEVPIDPSTGAPFAFIDGTGNPVVYGMTGINFLLDPGPPVSDQVEFSGVVRADFNSDGIFNGNDINVPGVKVYADVNRNGALDAGEIVVDTDINGQYNLIVPNTTSTVINVGVIAPPNWNFSDPDNGFSSFFVEFDRDAQREFVANFELTPPLGTSAGDGSSNPGYLMGAVYQDSNNNGTRQANELGVPGLQVFIDTNNNGSHEGFEPTTTTNVNGAYIFAGVAPGMHFIRAVPVAPLLSINPAPGVARVVTLAGGGTVSQIEFGVSLGENPLSSNVDFGDLPAAYGITTLAENGARHAISNYYLGQRIDFELDGQPTDLANGDDLVGADEDGIVVDPLIKGATGRLVATASRHGGNLQGWIDWNGDFVFQASEKVISNEALVPGENIVEFQIPANFTDNTIYARFRYGEFGIDSVTGPALIGEVEDYILAKDATALPVVIEHGPDFDEDGDIDGRDFLTWQRNHGTTNAAPSQGDSNSDGVVDYSDLVQWRNLYGTSSGNLSALTAEDPAAPTTGDDDLSVPIAPALVGVDEEESTLVEAILIVDTYDQETLTSVTEASAQSSTPRTTTPEVSSAAALLFASDSESSAVDIAVVSEASDLDIAFEESLGLVDLGVVLRDSSRERYAAARYLRDAGSEAETDEDNAFELAFAEEADWRQF